MLNKKMKIDVPQIKQSSETTCGAAVLLMLYEYYGIENQTEKKIWNRLKLSRKSEPGKSFMRTLPMAQDSEQFHLEYLYGQVCQDSQKLSLQPIKEFLNLSIPVVVCQKISRKDHLGHFRIVTGIEGDYLLINDPQLNKPSKMKIKKFLYLWSKANNDEVIGGEFFAIFKKNKLLKKNSFTVTNFYSSADYFNMTGLEFS